jgi:hypothetical protein
VDALDQLGAHRAGCGARGQQHPPGRGVGLAEDRQQQVRRVDALLAQPHRLAQRLVERVRGRGRERELAAVPVVAHADEPHHLGPRAVAGQPGAVQQHGRVLLTPRQAHEHVLGADVRVVHQVGLGPRDPHDLARRRREAVEHRAETSGHPPDRGLSRTCVHTPSSIAGSGRSQGRCTQRSNAPGS